ncbi:hypothetical protein PZ61_0235935 [Streptomyces sp. MNU77]|uniref:AMP-binding protein n=1 Tax=Streptomyces sp. MNU77 TaxID=1573406 RepID=UPI0005E1CD28|nr:AMP-binding protein [Streptomyces sp. MNU77]OLO25825.1 hypothetical protein PZ61_0235935 [Streptomyces sp. MNU77]
MSTVASAHQTQPAESIWQRAAGLGDKPAVVDPDGGVIGFAALATASHRVSKVLTDLGVRRGDVVCGLFPNTHAALVVYLAALETGVYYCPLNTHLTGPEIAYVLRDSGAGLFVADEALGELAVAAADEAGLAEERRLGRGRIPGFSSLGSRVAAHTARPPDHRPAGHRLYYTSGTTGRPKGVLRPLPDVDADTAAVRNAVRLHTNSHLPLDEDQVHLVVGPLYHGGPLGHAVTALHLGQTVVLTEKFSAEGTLGLIQRYRVTTSHFVPTMFHRMLKLPVEVRSRYDHSSLRAVVHAAAPCPPTVKRAMIDWWGPIVHEYYGTSEGGSTSVTAQEWLERPGTVGRPVRGAAVRILDESGREVPAGSQGLVHFRMGERFEYLHEPEKTAASQRGDYFTAGDIGYLDADGYLFLCDRQAETIISGGVNIYPAETEAALLTHPAVADAAVVGVPDDEWGEQVRAVVQLTEGHVPDEGTAQDIIDHCRAALSSFKCPRQVDFVAVLPYTATGKLLRREVRAPYWQGRDHTI